MSNPDSPQFDASIWMSGLPERELYDIYSHTLNDRFPAFGVRDFEKCRFDLAQPLHQYRGDSPLGQDILNIIVTPESHERYAQSLDEYIKKYGLQSWLDYEGSIVFMTDHGQFTDIPITAETIGRVGLGRRETTVQVVSKMISLMELDLGAGPFDVIKKLQNISAVAQTVPRLDGNPSIQLEKYRECENESGLTVLEAIRDTPGTSTVVSVIGRHNKPSKNGNTLYIHEPNKRTLETYFSSHVKVVLVCIDCPTFRQDGGIEPAEMKFELFPPTSITDPKEDVKRITRMIREATNRMVGENYKHGVKIKSWKAQNAQRAARTLRQKVTQQLPAPSTEY